MNWSYADGLMGKIIMNNNNSVKMIGHDNRRPKFYLSITLGYGIPYIPCNLSCPFMVQLAARNIPEYRFALIANDGDEISARLAAIIIPKSDQAASVCRKDRAHLVLSKDDSSGGFTYG